MIRKAEGQMTKLKSHWTILDKWMDTRSNNWMDKQMKDSKEKRWLKG